MRASVEACKGKPAIAVTNPGGKHFKPADDVLATIGIKMVIYPQEILGRAGSSGSFMATALQPLAPLAFALLLTDLHQRTMYVIAALTTLITLYVWRTAGFAASTPRRPGRCPESSPCSPPRT